MGRARSCWCPWGGVGVRREAAVASAGVPTPPVTESLHTIFRAIPIHLHDVNIPARRGFTPACTRACDGWGRQLAGRDGPAVGGDRSAAPAGGRGCLPGAPARGLVSTPSSTHQQSVRQPPRLPAQTISAPIHDTRHPSPTTPAVPVPQLRPPAPPQPARKILPALTPRQCWGLCARANLGSEGGSAEGMEGGEMLCVGQGEVMPDF